MKTQSCSSRLFLTILVAAPLSALAAESEPASSWGLRDAPRLLTPAGAVEIVRTEIHDNLTGLRSDLRELRAGEREAWVKAGIAGARLAGADGGALLAARTLHRLATTDPAAPSPRLGESLPAQLADAPDRTFRSAVRGTARHALTGADIGDAVRGDLVGQAVDLVPATLRSIRHVATQPFHARTKEAGS